MVAPFSHDNPWALNKIQWIKGKIVTGNHRDCSPYGGVLSVFSPEKTIPLKILKHAQSIDFEKFKPVMLAALRSLLPGCPGWRPRPARAWSLDFPGWDLLRISWGIYWWFNGSYWDIPSGKLSHNYGKPPFYSWINQRTQWPFSSSQTVNVYRRERSKINMNKPSTIVSPLSNIISNWMVYDVTWP